ncbi:MAG: cell wall hydrolase [Chromatiaceae bacterium]|jgi:spore germination cell wall hydrolase CwlJ-like protein|nr:cell wall hydrolase [Candidatus Thioaporhodococcus sediminis]
MNLEVRTLFLAASLMASAPMNPVSANPAHEPPNPLVQDEKPDDGSGPAAGGDDGDKKSSKAQRRDKKKPPVVQPKSAKITKGLDAELRCLALNIYYEAGAEPYVGKQAVAAVTLNRVKSKSFPPSICGVVKQRNKKTCQFSWVCQRPNAQPEQDSEAWRDALEIARKTINGQHQDPTHGAIYFHATRVKPDWSRVHTKTTRIGQHIFYKPAKKAA